MTGEHLELVANLKHLIHPMRLGERVPSGLIAHKFCHAYLA